VTRWERFFLVVQRISSVLVLLFVVAVLAVLAQERFTSWRQDRAYGAPGSYGSDFEPQLPYSAQEIETADGALIALMEHDETPGERIARGGLTLTNPTTGKFVEVGDEAAPNVVQFELIFEQGEDGKVVGYLATVASREQFEDGRQDLVVGALPAMTRNVVARNIRYSDLPRIRGDGSVGMLMWPEEGEAYLIAIRLGDGAIIERTRVKLPTLKQNRLSQGTGDGYFLPGRGGVPNEAPRADFGYME
jgi:hypothetical protein